MLVHAASDAASARPRPSEERMSPPPPRPPEQSARRAGISGVLTLTPPPRGRFRERGFAGSGAASHGDAKTGGPRLLPPAARPRDPAERRGVPGALPDDPRPGPDLHRVAHRSD